MKTNQIKTTDNSLTREAITAERDAWENLFEAYPEAVTAIAEYAYMIDLCVSCVFPKADRPEPRHLCKLLLSACNSVDGNAALTLTYCWREFDESVDSGDLPAEIFEGLAYLSIHAPATFAVLEHLDALLPSVLCFQSCPRLLAPAALVRFTIAAVRDYSRKASRAA